MRRKRRTKYTWLPTIPTIRDEDALISGRYLQFDIGSFPDTTPPTVIVPVIEDEPGETIAAGPGDLVNIIGTEYILKRIVGKLTVAVAGTIVRDNASIYIPAVKVTCGFFVARADGNDQQRPVGAPGVDDAFAEYGVSNARNIREPWMWRRSWVLSPSINLGYTQDPAANTVIYPGTPIAGSSSGRGFPANNSAYGSIQDGPHVDVKSARRVSNDDRLWFVATVAPWPENLVDDTMTDPFQVLINLDCRYLGALRKARNRSTF